MRAIPATMGRTGTPHRSGEMMATRHLRASEAAEILHVSPKTISRWAAEGKLPFTKTLGGHRRYPEDELRKLMEGRRVPVTVEVPR
jgi:excisionase family DNA binding protein